MDLWTYLIRTYYTPLGAINFYHMKISEREDREVGFIMYMVIG